MVSDREDHPDGGPPPGAPGTELVRVDRELLEDVLRRQDTDNPDLAATRALQLWRDSADPEGVLRGDD